MPISPLVFLAVFLGVSAAFGGPGSVVDVSTAALADGLTLVSITASVELEENRWKWEKLSKPERALFRFQGFDRHPRRGNFVTGDPVVQAVRFGYHPEYDPTEIHVVLDLGGEQVHVADIRTAGHTLLIHVVQTDPEVVESPPTPSPPRRPVSPPAPTPTAGTVAPLPAPTPFVELSPTPTPSPPDPGSRSTGASPTKPGFPKIEEIVVSSRGNGSTTLRITTDMPLKENAFGCYRLADPPPRQVLSLIGVQESNLNPRVPESQTDIRRIDLKSTPIHHGDRVDITIAFTAETVGVIEIAQRGKHLVLLLGQGF